VTESQRNFVILIAVVLVGSLFFSEGFGLGTAIAGMVLNVLFTIAMVTFLIILYRRHQGTIATMPSMPRTVLQASGLLLIFLMLGGLLAFFLPELAVLREPMIFWPGLMLSIFGIWWAWQQRTMRW